MSSQKCKRTDFMLKEKEIINIAKKEPNQTKMAREISKKWGIEVKSTRHEECNQGGIKARIPSKYKKLKLAPYSKLDNKVLIQLKQAR